MTDHLSNALSRRVHQLSHNMPTTCLLIKRTCCAFTNSLCRRMCCVKFTNSVLAVGLFIVYMRSIWPVTVMVSPRGVISQYTYQFIRPSRTFVPTFGYTLPLPLPLPVPVSLPSSLLPFHLENTPTILSLFLSATAEVLFAHQRRTNNHPMPSIEMCRIG